MKRLLPSLLLLLSLVGCMSSPKSTYYTLSPVPIPQEPARNKIRLMVGPIALPDLLDQPKLVVHASGNEVKLHDYDRWAGSLKNDIGRVVAAKLALDLSTSAVWSFSQSTETDADYQVLIDVQNLDSRVGESVLLDMLWTVRPKDTKRKPFTGRSLVRETVDGSSIDALVAAQSRAFAAASADIARAIGQR